MLRIGVVIGCLVVLVASAAVTIGASPSPRRTRRAAPAGRLAQAATRADGPQGLAVRSVSAARAATSIAGGSLMGQRIDRFGGAITITKIDGSNVSLKTADGWTRTIAVTDTTQIRIGSQAGKLSDLNVGDTSTWSRRRTPTARSRSP